MRAFQTSVLLKLFIHGYLNRIPSNRRLERATGWYGGVMWLTGQMSSSDPDARAKATSARRSGLVGDNVLGAIESESHLIPTHDVTNQGFDRDRLSPMATTAREALNREYLNAIADKGYFSGAEIRSCREAGIILTVARLETSGSRSKGMFVKVNVHPDPDRDVCRCPARKELKYHYTRNVGIL